MRPHYFFSSLVFLFIIGGSLTARATEMADTVTIKVTGTVLDADSQQPLAYAAVSLLSRSDSSLVDGVVTDDNGQFTLEAQQNNFMVRVEYISYEPKYFSDFSGQRNGLIKLDKIYLSAADQMLQEVQVKGRREQVVMSLDKKVFNVSEDLSRIGGNAQDVLDNIPSVTVDVDGNVSLRGSGNVRILINGKQSGLVGISGADALRQLGSNMIERVEVVTNPSAKYDAEGMGGIINIVLKKDSQRGINGSFDLYTGFPQNHSATANLNYRREKINFFGSYGFQYRSRPGNSSQRRTLTNDDGTTDILVQDETFLRSEYSHNLRGGLEYYITPKNTLTGSVLFRTGRGNNTNTLNQLDYDGANELLGGKIRNFSERETEPNMDYTLSYKRIFNDDDHVLTVDANYTYGFEEELADIDEEPYSTDVPVEDLSDQFSSIVETNDNFVMQADYTQPFFGNGKLDAGLKSSLRTINNDYFVEERQDGEWVTLPDVTNQFDYNENIHAAYASLGDDREKFTYQVGVRVEATQIATRLIETNEANDKEYLNVFPTGHFGYKLKNFNTLQLSYSRRIDRPYYRSLSPFYNYNNPYYLRTGNPNLNPEFTHSFELAHMKNWERSSLSSAVYYRHTDGETERIERVNDEGVTISRPENLATENSMGLELVASSDVLDWWTLNGSANFFRSVVEGSVTLENNEVINLYADTYSWFARLNSRMNLRVVDFQAMFNYRAAAKTTQGRRQPYSYLDLAFVRDVWGEKGTLSLKVSDVFNSRVYRSTSSGENFSINRSYRRSTTQVSLGLTFRLNQRKQRGDREGRGEGGGDGGDDY